MAKNKRTVVNKYPESWSSRKAKFPCSVKSPEQSERVCLGLMVFTEMAFKIMNKQPH